MTPAQLARDALAGQMTPLDALVRIAGMEEERTRRNHPIERALATFCEDPRRYNERINGEWGSWLPDEAWKTLKDGVRAYCDDVGIYALSSAPHADSTPAITDEVVERFWATYTRHKGSDLESIRAALEEFVRQQRPLTHPQEIRRATEQAAREAANKAMTTCPVCYAPKGSGHDCWRCSETAKADYHPTVDAAAHAAVYAQTADREAGGVAWGCGEPFDPWKSKEWQQGWRATLAQCSPTHAPNAPR